MPRSSPLYQPDLARIHIEGYAFHWESASPAILQWLAATDIRTGTIVDLGCGGGQWLAQLAEKGYSPVGVDISPTMIRAARKLVPGAKLICDSFADAKLPPCDAATSLGEPLNYLPNRTQFRRALRNVARALRPGGLFIFDLRVPATKPVPPRVVARTGDDWACISCIEEVPTKPSPLGRVPGEGASPTGRITRHITTFRRHGRGYRRHEEVHRLLLYAKSDISAWLKSLDFHTRTARGYGEYLLGTRQVVFIAQKRDAPRR